MTVYPEGAMRSINDLLPFAGKMIYEASRTHSHGEPWPKKFNGIIGTQHHRNTNTFYYYYECGGHRQSFLDMHLIDQSYNDWFVFGSLEDAKAYLADTAWTGNAAETANA